MNYNIEESFGFLLGRAAHLMQKRLNANFEQQGFDLSHAQWIVLMKLLLHDGQNQKELSESISRDKTSITRILETLELKGLIRRVEEREDRRVKRIFLTTQGKSLFPETLTVGQQTVKESLADVRKEDLEICKKVLKSIHKNLSENKLVRKD